MYSGAEEHVIYQITNTPIREYPYPHIYVDEIFPPDFYSALRHNWPEASHLVSLQKTGRVPEGAYPERFVMPLREAEVHKLPEEHRRFWTGFADWVLKGQFLYALIDKFAPFIHKRFGTDMGKVEFSPEVLVVRDHTNYKIGPHTDAPHRLLSLLFYCPDDDRMKHLGTSIYAPIDPEFRCEGGPHYPHHMFKKITTLDYKPNTLFAFFKTDHSFHGVEPILDTDVLRDLILYDIRVTQDLKAETRASASHVAGFKMLRSLFGFK